MIPIAAIIKFNPEYISIVLYVLAAALCCTGTCWVCFSIRTACLGTLAPPPKPDPLNPFLRYSEEPKASGKKSVKKVIIIMNPFGGGGRAKPLLKEATQVWDELGVEYKVIETKYSGHAIELAQTMDLDKYDALCILGGDGSFHELVNGYMSRTDGKQITLGLLPGGSGNSILADFGKPSVKDVAKWIAEGNYCWMDANQIQFSERTTPIYSVNLIALGILGDIGIIAEEYRWLGIHRYTFVALWILLKRILLYLKAEFDEENLEGEFLTLSVNLTQHAGNAVRLCPDARLDDDLMDVIFMGGTSRGELLRLFVQLTSGRVNPKDKGLLRKQVKQLKIELNKPGKFAFFFFFFLNDKT